MIPKRYSILLADRTSGAVRRFTVSVRPTLAVAITLFACVTALGLHARWTTIAEIEGLRMRNATLGVENASYRKAADTLADQMALLEVAMTDLGTRSELDPASQEAIDRLPSRVRVRAIGESLLPGLPPPRAPLPTELSPKYTLALLQDLLGNLESRPVSASRRPSGGRVPRQGYASFGPGSAKRRKTSVRCLPVPMRLRSTVSVCRSSDTDQISS